MEGEMVTVWLKLFVFIADQFAFLQHLVKRKKIIHIKVPKEHKANNQYFSYIKVYLTKS